MTYSPVSQKAYAMAHREERKATSAKKRAAQKLPGVSYNTQVQLWQAQMNKDGKRVPLGFYLNMIDANEARRLEKRTPKAVESKKTRAGRQSRFDNEDGVNAAKLLGRRW